MCVPVVLGVVTAITGIVGSIAGYAQQQQEVDYQNAVNQQQYQLALQQTEYQNQLNRQQYEYQMQLFDRSVNITEQQYQLNAEAANRSYVSEQNKLRYEYQKTAIEQQKLLVSSLQAQGTVLAAGRTGQSVGLLMGDAERQYGRDLATLGLNLATARNDFFNATESIFIQAQNANNQTASQRMLEPVQPMDLPKPLAPIGVPSPSPIGMIAGIGSSIVGGYQTYSALKPPAATVPSPGGGSWSSGGMGSSQFQPNTPSLYTPRTQFSSPIPQSSWVR